MKILITGASGFIGSYLIKKLKKKNLLLTSKKNKNYISIDLIKENFTKLDSHKIDTCIHLAWSGIPDYSKKNSQKNYNDSIKLFNYLYKSGCKKIISLGSCWEYNEDFGKKNENSSDKSQNIFGHYKKKLAKDGLKLSKKFNSEFVWLRIFYVYGDRKKGLLKILNENYQKKTKINLLYPYKFNDFIFIDDVVDFIKKSIKLKKNGIFNVGTGKKVSTLDFCNKFCEIKKINPNEIIKYDIKKKKANHGIWADMKKSKNLFNKRKFYSLKQGISKSLKYIN